MEPARNLVIRWKSKRSARCSAAATEIQPLILGSVKTNIGHLEAAAGVLGLIKVILALRHRTIPPHLHFKTPSPHIAWQDLPFIVPRQPTPWQPINGRRIGGVSSFGFSGTNAHVVVEEAPTKPVAAETSSGRKPPVCAVCPRSSGARPTRRSARRGAAAATAMRRLADICRTANEGRAHFAERATLVAGTIDGLRAGLEALSRGEDAAGLMA